MLGRNLHPEARAARERAFWDEEVPSLQHCLESYEAGPDANAAAMLDALEPLAGASVLDFACGPGVMSAWLSDRGAEVIGLDVSARATARAAELCRRVGAAASFVTGELDALDPGRRFDRIGGRFALHHVDTAAVGPDLARRLRRDGTAAFVETMATNPVLAVARRSLTGRLGIPRYGTADEHPLTRRDLQLLERAFGTVRVVAAEIVLARIFDRQVFGFRNPRVSRVCAVLDRFLTREGWEWLSYHQVLVLTRT